MTRVIVTSCDRCGKQVTNDIRLVATSLSTTPAPHQHLCMDCAKTFDAWLKANQ